MTIIFSPQNVHAMSMKRIRDANIAIWRMKRAGKWHLSSIDYICKKRNQLYINHTYHYYKDEFVS